MKECLGIIVPVYNEADNIKATITAIEEKVRTPHKIYIVYDFDEDNTLPMARELQKEGFPIEFLKNPDGGVANAIKTGLRNARENYLLVSMADLSDDYSVVDKMCAIMSEGYDLVCGSRYMKGGKQFGGPVVKKFLSRMAGVSLRYITGLPTFDATNSFKLYSKGMLDLINMESDGGFEIGIEILVKAHFAGFKVTEVPSVWRDRQQGESKFKIFKWAPKYLRWYFYALKKALCSSPKEKNKQKSW
jgi:glycosyltransferase involved in cell wall biosynthesis